MVTPCCLGNTFFQTEMNREEVKEHLETVYSCGICTQILYQPVTLFCQHTFCRACLREMSRPKPYELRPSKKKCPTCRRRFFLPEGNSNNYQINESLDALLNRVFTPAEIEEMNKTRKKEEIRMELREQVVQDLREELQNSILDSIQVNEGEAGDLAEIISPSENSPQWEPLIHSWNSPPPSPTLSHGFWNFVKSPECMGLMLMITTIVSLPLYVYQTISHKSSR